MFSSTQKKVISTLFFLALLIGIGYTLGNIDNPTDFTGQDVSVGNLTVTGNVSGNASVSWINNMSLDSKNVKNPPAAPALGYAISHFVSNFSVAVVDFFNIDGTNWLGNFNASGYSLFNALYFNGTNSYITTLNVSGRVNSIDINNTIDLRDSNAATECAGTTTYYDGEGNCDDISGVYAPINYGDTWNKTYADTLYQVLEATLTDIADGTIAENLVNTANPWADNEVSDTLTCSILTAAANQDIGAYNLTANGFKLMDNERLWMGNTGSSYIYDNGTATIIGRD